MKIRLALIVTAVSVVLLVGAAGFALIAGYPLFDALYMTLTTMTTVGYMEIHPLDRSGRIFNVFIIIFGVSAMFFAIGVMTDFIIRLQFGEVFGKRRVRTMIGKLRDHYIVCGHGRVGRGAANELRRSGASFVIVDGDPAEVERAIKHGFLAVVADATSDETLREVGIERARGLIAALRSDADNLFLILSAKALNPALKVASRVNEEESEAKLRRAGADAVFRPYNTTGYRLAQAILRPYVSEFLDLTTSTVDMGLNIAIEQVKVADGSEFSSKSLRELQFRRDLGVIVLAIRKAAGTMLFNPPADAVIESGDHLVVMGSVDHLRALEQLMAMVKA
ncbi:MAG: potassium channel protein [Bryobacteraceae bacterium]|nr:potassium channel protein [Bryobacteraceae bacterium]